MLLKNQNYIFFEVNYVSPCIYFEHNFYGCTLSNGPKSGSELGSTLPNPMWIKYQICEYISGPQQKDIFCSCSVQFSIPCKISSSDLPYTFLHI
jgi:hypothetical protein